MLLRFGARRLTELAVPDTEQVIDPLLLQAAAAGAPLDEWLSSEIAIAQQALARIADAAGRARSEVLFYLRYRQAEQAAPEWALDDVMELARYHLVDSAGKKGSTVRTRYRDVLKRLQTLAAEDRATAAPTSAGSN
jgi:phage gp36-like protein